MRTVQTQTLELKGSSYEIGRIQGRRAAKNPAFLARITSGFDGFGADDVQKAKAMFHRWCPGLCEELEGFADEIHVFPEQILFYAMTYLRPACSQIALLPKITQNHHPMLARSYEFNDEAEDFTLVKTSADGKYTHIGTSVLCFGRDDGFNEHGLAVSMSSTGFPVGAVKSMRRPAVTGLQFWAVIRTLLEQCRTVSEACGCLKDMPIAYNMNLMMLDKGGHAALAETLDGRMAVKSIDSQSDEAYLHATNHPHLAELIPYEPKAMSNSLVRYRQIQLKLGQSDSISIEDMKQLLLTPYPDGLCSYCFKEFFGTTKSMIIDPLDGTIELCWGGSRESGFHHYSMDQTFPDTKSQVAIADEQADPDLFAWESLE